MFWFNWRKKETERRMNMIGAIKPTSKTSLKMQCLCVAKGNVDEACKLYEFFAKDMQSLPDFDPIQPTLMENLKGNAISLYRFVSENKDDIAQGIEFIRSILSKGNRDAVPDAVVDLPPINE